MSYSDVILLSGGVDSAFLAITVAPDIAPGLALFVDYGQPSIKRERRAASAIADRVGLDFKELKVDGLELGGMDEWESGLAIVPARNAWLISLAAAFGKNVWIGASPSDADYPDCQPVFLGQFSVALNQAYGSCVSYSPATREHRLRVLAEHGYDEITWSCYGAGDNPCGQCASCSQ